jgi:hypothetical protein
MGTIELDAIYFVAVDLLSEDGENPEYDRAIADMVAEIDAIDGMDLDTRSGMVANDLRRMKKERGW